MKLTAALLQAATGCSAERAELYAEPLTQACLRYDITSPERIAAFLAQLAHESGAFRHTVEIWGPTAQQARYEGRKDLGNVRLGDGFLYRGRGLIQVTGRANYASASARLGVDLVAAPELLEQPKWAALSAGDWWAANRCNILADAGDFVALGRLINRGNARSTTPANGEEDRLQRWARAKQALAAMAQPETAPEPVRPQIPTPEPAPVPAPPRPRYPDPPRPDQEPYVQEAPMPIAPIIGAILPALIEYIPRLGKAFGSGSAVSERNIAAATMAVEVVQQATGAINAQDALEKIKADPAMAAAAAKAVESRWLEITEAGGGGIDGARKADAVASGGDMLKSPSFWIAMVLVPLVYLIVFSLIGMIGTATWSDDVRAGLAGSLISAIIGGLVGYYFGQTTTRNRMPAP